PDPGEIEMRGERPALHRRTPIRVAGVGDAHAPTRVRATPHVDRPASTGKRIITARPNMRGVVSVPTRGRKPNGSALFGLIRDRHGLATGSQPGRCSG